MLEVKAYRDNTIHGSMFEAETIEEIKGCAFCWGSPRIDKKFRFFDNNGVFHVGTFTEAICKEVGKFRLGKTYNITYEDYSLKVFYWSSFCVPNLINGVFVNATWAYVIFNTLTDGVSTLEDFVIRYNSYIDFFLEVYCKEDDNFAKAQSFASDKLYNFYPSLRGNVTLSTQILKRQDKEIMSFIYRLERPIFERETGNNNKNTFDFIRVRASIPSKEEMPNRVDFIKKNTRRLVNCVIELIECNKTFQKYGVPSNILRLSNLTLTFDGQLEFLFCIKEVSR